VKGAGFVSGSSDEVVTRPFVRFVLCPVPGVRLGKLRRYEDVLDDRT
jgi:hypothetical protein